MVYEFIRNQLKRAYLEGNVENIKKLNEWLADVIELDRFIEETEHEENEN